MRLFENGPEIGSAQAQSAVTPPLDVAPIGADANAIEMAKLHAVIAVSVADFKDEMAVALFDEAKTSWRMLAKLQKLEEEARTLNCACDALRSYKWELMQCTHAIALGNGYFIMTFEEDMNHG